MFKGQRNQARLWRKMCTIIALTMSFSLVHNQLALARWDWQVPEEPLWAVSQPVQYTISYRVQEGETLWELAQLYDLDVDLIAAMNGMENTETIRPGQILTLPAEQTTIHEVSKGDTIWGIAQLYGVKPDLIIWENDLQDESLIKEGQKLVISLPMSRRIMSMVRNVSSRGLIESLVAWPVSGVISSRFGWRWGQKHQGLDIAADQGTPIKAALGGVVKFATRWGTYGNVVILEHPSGYKTLYAHASKLLVKKGERVYKGQTIAKVGSTGRSTGPHVHFEVQHNGIALNPEKLLP